MPQHAFAHLTVQEIAQALVEGHAQVFFDALDEVFDPSHREEIVDQIVGFANDYPSAQIIVTSRVVGYRGSAFRDARFLHYVLQDFDSQQIATFLSIWHAHTYRSDEAAERDARQAQLHDAIVGYSPIRELAGNPLLLTMLAVLNRYRSLPHDRTDLYTECSRLLLQQWKAEEALRADPELSADVMAIGLPEKEAILRRLAREMYSSRTIVNLVGVEMLESIILECVRPIVRGSPHTIARALVAQLRERNFILCFAGGESYAFVHRTFLDFYFAMDLKRRFEKAQTLSLAQLKSDVYGAHCFEEGWHESLTMLAGTLDPRFVSKLVLHLLQLQDPEGMNRHVFLAASCLSEVRNQAQLEFASLEVCAELERVAETDVDPAALCHREPLVRCAADTLRSRQIRAVHLRASVCGLTAGTRSWLERRASFGADSTVRFAAVQALTRYWSTDPALLRWLQEQAQQNSDVNVRYAAIEELARSWREVPAVFTLLKGFAHYDPQGSIRYAAIRALAQGWGSDPELRRLLITHMRDDDAIVRYAAVRELVRIVGAHEDGRGDLLAMLKLCIETDDSGIVRYAAIQELARGWTSHPETLELLVKRAKTDDDSVVRYAAIQALIHSWPNHAATLRSLRDQVESDSNLSVRRLAWEEILKGWRSDPKMVGWISQRRKFFRAPPSQSATIDDQDT